MSVEESVEMFLSDRMDEACQEMYTDPEYCALKEEENKLLKNLKNAVPEEQRTIVREYTEHIGQRSAIVEETLFKAGFRDGIKAYMYALDRLK